MEFLSTRSGKVILYSAIIAAFLQYSSTAGVISTMVLSFIFILEILIDLN